VAGESPARGDLPVRKKKHLLQGHGIFQLAETVDRREARWDDAQWRQNLQVSGYYYWGIRDMMIEYIYRIALFPNLKLGPWSHPPKRAPYRHQDSPWPYLLRGPPFHRESLRSCQRKDRRSRSFAVKRVAFTPSLLVATFLSLHGEQMLPEPLFLGPLPSPKTRLLLSTPHPTADRNHLRPFHSTPKNCRHLVPLPPIPYHHFPSQVPPKTSQCSKLWRYLAAVVKTPRMKMLERRRRKVETP